MLSFIKNISFRHVAAILLGGALIVGGVELLWLLSHYSLNERILPINPNECCSISPLEASYFMIIWSLATSTLFLVAYLISSKNKKINLYLLALTYGFYSWTAIFLKPIFDEVIPKWEPLYVFTYLLLAIAFMVIFFRRDLIKTK